MQNSQPKASRRGFFLGAAAAGAVAATLAALPNTPAMQLEEEQPKAAPENGGGYSLSDHVKQYYRTTRL